jgi:hypothetical protein
MSNKIEILHNLEVIKVTYERNLTLDQRLAVVHELCVDFNIFKRFRLLIDVRNIKQEMTPLEQEIFGKFIASKEEFDMALVAVLDNIQQPVDQIMIHEASKEGYQIKMFGSEEVALAWLNN